MNNRGLSLEERAHEMHPMLCKDLMNKTSVTTQAQYFTFIGQIPRNSHEYHLYNTARSMGRRGRSRRPWWISSTVRLEAKVGRKGTRVAFCPPKDASVRWRGGGGGKQEVQWLASTPVACLLSRGPGGQEAKEATLPAQVCSISAQYQSHSEDRWGVLLQQPSMPGEMTSWSLSDFFTQCWSRSILPA